LFEAASAHYLATGKRNFLNIALRNADLLTQVFGHGKRNDAPGHGIAEMRLVRLYRITGEKKYLDLAKFFIDCRGKNIDKKRAYWHDHEPVIQQKEAVGHAVRAAYLYSGVADVAALTGNKEYLAAIDSIWENMVSKNFISTAVLEPEATANGSVIIMNCPTKVPITKPALPLPMCTGTFACLNCTDKQNTLMCLNAACITIFFLP